MNTSDMNLKKTFIKSNEVNNYLSQELVIVTKPENFNIHVCEKMKKPRFKFCSSVVTINKIKYILYLLIFILSTYLFSKYVICFKIIKIQQINSKLELDKFYTYVEQKLKQLYSFQEVTKNEVKSIYTLNMQDLKRIEFNEQCEITSLNLRFDCHPEKGASELTCADRRCCWHPLYQFNNAKQIPLNVPFCYYPKNWNLYKYENFSKHGNNFLGFLHLDKKSFYKEDLPFIKIETSAIDDDTLQVKIFDAKEKRYEPPLPKRSNSKLFLKQTLFTQYEFEINEKIPGFKVIRQNNKRVLFDTIGIGGFIFANQFLQITSKLSSHNIYGLGEHRTNLRLNTNWQKFTLFNADQPPTENANLYGSHPFYMVIERTGEAHGVLFLNSNAMDIILQPTPAITFRSIGGIFDIYFFMGPKPADVLKQYAQIVGKPFLPPYWSLGFHLCRFGYASLNNTKVVWKRTKDALIPFDTQWNDLDYMDKRNDFTYDKVKFKDLPNFIKEIHKAGMHYIPLIDAGISASEKNGSYIPYDEGIFRGIFIYDAYSNQPFIGKVWNLESTVWPDFTNPEAILYYTEMMNNLHKSFEYDGVWIDMNEPSNFYNGHFNGCTLNSFDSPPYVPNVIGNLLSRKTLCMNAKQYLGYHYNLHNIYGTSQSVAVNHALKEIRNKRPFIISRSTWIGHGFYAGHWTGDVYSSWHDLRMSIPDILMNNLFQIPMVGADICGFDGNTTEVLCNRWIQLGAFYPFSRNHNSDDTTEQDPVAMGHMVVMSSKKALRTRYYLLPYLYSLFYRAHLYAETVARPLFVEFYKDLATFNIDTQFLWGSCLLISPVLNEAKTEVNAYVPKGIWYNFYTMDILISEGKNYILDAPIDTIPLLLRGGCILPVQEPSITTTLSRLKPFGLLVALNEQKNAKGELYWDDGDSLDSVERKHYILMKFEAIHNELISCINEGYYNGNIKLGKIIIIGISEVVKQVFFNKKPVKFKYDQEKLTLQVSNLLVNFTKNFTLNWTR